MKRILGSALVIGVLAYGLSGNGQIFANETKTEDIPKVNTNYNIEQVDANSNIPDENQFNKEDENYEQNNFYGNCDGQQNGSRRGCQGRGKYRENRSNSNNINYSNMQIN